VGFLGCPGFSIPSSYRTLSLHQTIHDDGQQKVAVQAASDPATAIRQIDAHKIPVNEVYTRFSTSPALGLERAAVQRLAKLGKNVISPPPTQYYKKVLNYVFGGFNFLMWIAFIVTIVRLSLIEGAQHTKKLLP
jgi:sodium/potassium-transporting ATPase subunit alpha